MARVKRAVNAQKKRRTTLERASGYRGQRSRLYRKAKEQVTHSLVYAYRDRKARKGDFRKLWIQRINAASREQGMTYNRLIQGLKLAGVEVDRRVLADLAVNDAAGVHDARRGRQGRAARRRQRAEQPPRPDIGHRRSHRRRRTDRTGRPDGARADQPPRRAGQGGAGAGRAFGASAARAVPRRGPAGACARRSRARRAATCATCTSPRPPASGTPRSSAPPGRAGIRVHVGHGRGARGDEPGRPGRPRGRRPLDRARSTTVARRRARGSSRCSRTSATPATPAR